jgi:beta-galactosidase
MIENRFLKLFPEVIKKQIFSLGTALMLILLTFSGYTQTTDEFMTSLYDKLHDSPLQQKFKTIHPMPAGVVYVQHPEEGEKEIREHFRLMKKLGFNSLKQIQTVEGWTNDQISLIALDEGIIPWWYGQGGWEAITPALLKNLGIPENTPVNEIRKNPKMIDYQFGMLRKVIIDSQKSGTELIGSSQAYEPEIGGRGIELSEAGEKLFVDWCKKTYGSVEKLNKAWNTNHIGLLPPGGSFRSWDDFSQRWKTIPGREMRNNFDILKFKVDHKLAALGSRAENFRTGNPNGAFRAGGELGLFRPQASFCVDLESVANVMTNYGSFYPSIHLVWHFNEVNGETARPFYMQSSLAADYFKGGWAGPWEATGGPQQLSGEKSLNTGFTVDEGIMTQFILSQIAGGFKGFGLWCWSVRTAGLEGGEYSLLDRNNQPGPRAIKVGKIAQAMDKYRDEIWEAHKEPVVGVLTDWNNEAMMTVLSIKSRPDYAFDPYYCRIGVSRALINANLPFEYVTVRDLKAGLAPRYKIIYLPGNLTFTEELMPILTEYVNHGGRVVMDMPGAIMDEFSRVYPTGKGSDFEKLFGTTVNDFQFSGFNITNTIDGLILKGFTVYATPTTAKVMTKYNNGNPAIMENRLGKGTAVLIGYEASKMCLKPGNTREESMLLKYSIGSLSSPYKCNEAIVYRLSSPSADHYFLINDSDKPVKANLTFRDYKYRLTKDAVSGEAINPGEIPIPPNNGIWIRCEK